MRVCVARLRVTVADFFAKPPAMKDKAFVLQADNLKHF